MWYKNQSHLVDTKLYAGPNGSGLYYKHLFQVFDIHMLVVQVKSESSKESNDVNEAYSQLTLLIEDLLIMLVNEQNSENYEITFSDVWIQILKTLSYQSNSITSSQSVEKFTQAFFNLSDVL